MIIYGKLGVNLESPWSHDKCFKKIGLLTVIIYRKQVSLFHRVFVSINRKPVYSIGFGVRWAIQD